MTYPDKINNLVAVTGDQTLAAGGHAARHNDVKEALEEVKGALGGGSPITASGDSLVLQSDASIAVKLDRYSADTGSPFMVFNKARGSIAAPAVVEEDDDLANISFRGYSAADGGFVEAARISSEVDGEPDTAGDTSDMPGRLIFRTTSDGSSGSLERMRINNAGAVLIGTTTPGSAGAGDLVVNGGVFLGGNAAANELDDYEEGTWTPTYEPETGAFTSITYSIQSGQYVKIGNLVQVQFDISVSALTVGTASGDLQLHTLPFATNGRGALSVGFARGWTNTPESGYTQSSGGSFVFLQNRSAASSATSDTAVSDMDASNINRIIGFMVYQTS